MSSDRSTNPNHNRPLKPTLASTRTARTPIAPRVAGNATPPTKSTASRSTPTVSSEPRTPKGKPNSTPIKEVLSNGNITPRSSARTSRPGSATASPRPADNAQNGTRPKLLKVGSGTPSERNENTGGLASIHGTQTEAPSNRPKSFVSENGSTQSPLLRSQGFFDLSPPPAEESIDSRFFHASDAPKQEAKRAQFFHADGKQEAKNLSPTARSPVLSAISEQRPLGPWIRSENTSHSSKTPSVQSPALSALSGVSPFFAPAAIQLGRQPSPTSSKENIHLSYRKGASQIFGTRPSPTAGSTTSNDDGPSPNFVSLARNEVLEPPPSGLAGHSKSPSLSSIGSGYSLQARKRSTTKGEPELGQITLAPTIKTAAISHLSKPPQNLPSIDTSLESPGLLSRTESGLSPVKPDSELAAEARRERKVLDLEISNSSLLAINASLEREVRRQKAELKSFRRLSRAGRFSFAPGDRMRSLSEDLSALAEENEDEDYFGLSIGSAEMSGDSSDEEESVASSTEPLGPRAQDRLAKDEKRLQIDLEKHKELLMQSQAMNQSIKRCTYATEDMIKEGKKALEYHVRVSDVKLGGRVLSQHENIEESQEIEIEDDLVQNDEMIKARDFLETWTNIERPNLERSENGDRDSGIEVDRHWNKSMLPFASPDNALDSGRPPGLRDIEKFGSFS